MRVNNMYNSVIRSSFIVNKLRTDDDFINYVNFYGVETAASARRSADPEKEDDYEEEIEELERKLKDIIESMTFTTLPDPTQNTAQMTDLNVDMDMDVNTQAETDTATNAMYVDNGDV